MGIAIYFDSIPRRYFKDFEKNFNSNDYDRFLDYYQWLMNSVRANDEEKRLRTWSHHDTLMMPISESPFIDQQIRMEIAEDLFSGEGAQHFLKDHLDYKNYISNKTLQKHLAILESSELGTFKKYAVSFSRDIGEVVCRPCSKTLLTVICLIKITFQEISLKNL